MIALQKRVTSVIARYGESFTVGASTSTGIFAPLTDAQAKTYLTEAEISAATKPMWIAYVPATDPSTVAAGVTWNGLSLTVQKMVNLRVKGTTAGKVLVLA